MVAIYLANLINQTAEHHNTENTRNLCDMDWYLNRKIQNDTKLQYNSFPYQITLPPFPEYAQQAITDRKKHFLSSILYLLRRLICISFQLFIPDNRNDLWHFTNRCNEFVSCSLPTPLALWLCSTCENVILLIY